jgi:signal transduction histidine kinase
MVTTPTTEDPAASDLSPRTRRWPRIRIQPSARLRILGWYAGLLLVALALALVLQSALLRSQLDGEVDRDMERTVDQLRIVVEERDSATGVLVRTGAPEVFDALLARAVLPEGQVIFTLVERRPYKSTVTPVQLLDQPELVSRWSAVTSTSTGELATSAGQVRWMAVPLLDGDTVRGTFVVANFLAGERAEIDDAVRIGAIAFIGVGALATLAAWLVAGRVLRPVRLLTETAREISEADWSRRIEANGDDEVAELTRTFNAMLDRLEAAYRTQRRFIDDAGHELATPITIIRGHLEVMGGDPVDREQAIAIVMDELDRMGRMVDDLLILAGAGHPDFVVVDEVNVAELTVELARRADALSDRPWTIEESAEGLVVIDRQRIIQAVMNLVRNALAHTPSGTAVALGSAMRRDTLRIWVRDEGPGISERHRAEIFERFARGAGARRTSDGAGLGLSIVEAIALGHGGHVELETALGQGSRFTIVVPVAPREANS